MKLKTLKLNFYIIIALIFCFKNITATAQSTWFADGFHGGIYGHYPLWVTQFMADTLNKYPNWKINLEIEPETWDTVQVKDPQGYEAFKKVFENQSVDGRIEYTNPSYAQSYLFPISGESIIRQFQYGMQKLKQHFPTAVFTTYSSEEPCFTSALPQILKSFGFKNAVLKNPNTCWGGYTRAYGGETVNWVGPDGTTITTVPRYASEALEPHSTWQTTAWNNSKQYINAALQQGIQHPIGMCLQDAGWRNGRWLGDAQQKGTAYTTWRNYFTNIANKNTGDNWRLSQEDVQVSLVWGSQVLQRIAQQVRASEHKIISAEKMASLAKLYADKVYPKDSLDAAWRTLLLSQHHDCWIVPYNGKPGQTWADHVKQWTEYTNSKSADIIQQSAKVLTTKQSQQSASIAVYNTMGFDREEVVSVPVTTVLNKKFKGQVVTGNNGTKQRLLKVKVPAMGYAVYNPAAIQNNIKNRVKAQQLKDGTYRLETDLYKIVVDPAKGGAITSLIAKQLGNKEFVDTTSQGFNTLRGNFYKGGGLLSSVNNKVAVSVVENGPLRVTLQVKGTLASHQYIQTIQLTQGESIIDCQLHIDYDSNLRVGENYRQDSGYEATDLHKAFYNDTSKLIALFPLALQHQKVYKDAPFDVTESKLNNTFFNRWDSIKNNIILNWVDVTDEAGKYGFTLLTDHTTSYIHGADFPLGLTVQYAGVGLWGRNYTTDSATNMHYAFIPHTGTWNKAAINRLAEQWNTPLFATLTNEPAGTHQSFVDAGTAGWQITSMTYENNDLLVRLYNAQGDNKAHDISFDCKADKAELVELNGDVKEQLQQIFASGKTNVRLAIPLFGIRTIRLVNAKH
ncbi:hypothetical protein FC093_12050 [Ilyomonas limi]|uniref:Glycoside hydrolase family 38 central domain-containing protein n=1 Tax=Ilyomonas limi TaxID=2575867 RepID=A0A4V5UU72_9BACT|nr:glycoside hydrolase family 38 C-terminal domain-containing protein [Ilyomonas limi]TKK67943.1 hypothetical protein FC093_12050 [Ilyomonas limi]